MNTVIGGTSDGIYLVVQNIGAPSGQGLDFINGQTFLERFYSVYGESVHDNFVNRLAFLRFLLRRYDEQTRGSCHHVLHQCHDQLKVPDAVTGEVPTASSSLYEPRAMVSRTWICFALSLQIGCHGSRTITHKTLKITCTITVDSYPVKIHPSSFSTRTAFSDISFGTRT